MRWLFSHFRWVFFIYILFDCGRSGYARRINKCQSLIIKRLKICFHLHFSPPHRYLCRYDLATDRHAVAIVYLSACGFVCSWNNCCLVLRVACGKWQVVRQSSSRSSCEQLKLSSLKVMLTVAHLFAVVFFWVFLLNLAVGITCVVVAVAEEI